MILHLYSLKIVQLVEVEVLSYITCASKRHKFIYIISIHRYRVSRKRETIALLINLKKCYCKDI